MMYESKLLKKWRIAARDLGLEIIVSYEVQINSKTKLRTEFLVKNFGGPNGTLIFTDSDIFWPYKEQFEGLGFGVATLDEPSNETNAIYDREIFIKMLSEWSWTGDPEKRPSWLLDEVLDEEL